MTPVGHLSQDQDHRKFLVIIIVLLKSLHVPGILYLLTYLMQ